MLGKPTRKKLSLPNWREIAKQYENPSAAVADFKKESNSAINDLILLANKLPNSEQREIFSPDNIKRLIEAILDGNKQGLHFDSKPKSIFKGQKIEYDKEFNNRILEISALLVKEGTRICMEYYKAHNLRIFEPVANTLNEAVEICNAIAFPFRITKSQTAKYNLHEKK